MSAQSKAKSFYKPSKGFSFQQPSKTVPGQVMTLKTILTRFRKGQGVQVYEGVYNPDFPPEYDKMDVLERMDAARVQAAEVDRMRRILSEPPPAPPAPLPDDSDVSKTKDEKNPTK